MSPRQTGKRQPLRRSALFWTTGLLAGLLLTGPAHAISVSLSDNVVVLDNRQRSGEIELLSMTPSPVEFEVEAMTVPEGIQDGSDYLRWSPARTLVPANRASPLRMVFRPPADLPPGEYVVRLAVKSRQVDFQPSFQQGPDDEVPPQDGLAIGVAIQPVLPVTVYIRHQVDSPALTIGTFEPAADDEGSHGQFMVRKAPEAVSFVGTVALVGQRSGETLTSGRLRMGQTATERRIRVPRREGEEALGEPVCLHIWPSFPARGALEQRVCSE
ncbi:hypothetical protein [Thioalkalivibrio sp. AKL12]|uniref:hypothetical protein n=1 Tax=Thioalkalivibrio sp. AKL12 TaxID=1158159 RepID=UPI0003A2248C|nr:hypothetical protein [Thioalkalivibrio sp. AKL12]